MATSYESQVDWNHYFFWGLSRVDPANVQLSPQQVQALHSMVGVDAAVSSVAALEPKYLINQKGVTVWNVLHVYAFVRDKEGLAAVSNGTAALYLPADVVQSAFNSHVNWPVELLQKYDFDFKDYWAFVIPFICHREHSAPIPLSQALDSPDGTMSILGVAEFDPERPEALLSRFHELYKREVGKTS